MIKLFFNILIILFISAFVMAKDNNAKKDKKRNTLKTARYVKVRHDALNPEDEVKESCPPCQCICNENNDNN